MKRVSWLNKVCLSVRMEQTGSNWIYFHVISYLCILLKPVDKIQVLLLSDKITTRYMMTSVICDNISLRRRNASDKSWREIQNTHVTSNNFFPKMCRLWDNVEKILHSRTGHGWQFKMAHTLWMLVNLGYRQTLRTCNIFPMTTRVTRMRLNIKV